MQDPTTSNVAQLEARRLHLIGAIRGMAMSHTVEPARAKLVGIRDMQAELNTLNKILRK